MMNFEANGWVYASIVGTSDSWYLISRNWSAGKNTYPVTLNWAESEAPRICSEPRIIWQILKGDLHIIWGHKIETKKAI